jgi:hypothetical protein
MAVTSTPTTVAYKDEGFLAAGISASATSLTVGAIYKWPDGVKTRQGIDSDSGFFELSFGDRTEIGSFDTVSVDATTKVSTVSGIRRGLPQTATTATFTAGTGLVWPKGTRFRVIDYSAYLNNTAFKDKANTFTEDQTIESGNKLKVGGSDAYVWTENSGTDLKFKDANNSEKTLSQLAAAGGSDEKFGISANDTTPDYAVNKITGGDGITVTETNDGGDETLDIDLDIPVLVASGGTGRTSHTAYAVLCGGTDTTTAQQSIASVGTLGQVFKSNGAGALPTFQDIGTTYFDKTVFMSATSSASVGASTTDSVDIPTHQYTIPADNLISGVAYEYEITGVYTIANSGGADTLTVSTVLGGVNIGVTSTAVFLTDTSLEFTIRGTIHGTAASGAAAEVRNSMLTAVAGQAPHLQYAAANVATNGSLLLKWVATFASSVVGNSVIIHTSRIRKTSTTAF